MEIVPLVLVLKITASPWQEEAITKDNLRIWQAPPMSSRNTAIRVHKVGKWPFRKYEWAVWSPFGEEGDDSVLDGEAASKEGAMDAADKALKELIAGAEEGAPPME